jgi:hypothetical protein
LAGALQTIHLDEAVEAEQATAFEITKTIRSVRARYLQPKDRPEGTYRHTSIYIVVSLAGCHLDSMCEVGKRSQLPVGFFCCHWSGWIAYRSSLSHGPAAVIINCKSADVQAVATKYRDMITTLAGTGALEYGS